MEYYYHGMPQEDFDDILTTAFEMGDFVPETEEEMAALNKSRVRVTAGRGEPATHEGKCHYDTFTIVWDIDLVTVLQWEA